MQYPKSGHMNTSISREIPGFLSSRLFDGQIPSGSDMSYPRISVVTPSYNQGEFLERTILSVLNQNYPNLEYIIIDGGSNDGSLDIIKKYDKYLTYWVSEKDAGQSDALNKGFAKATGQIYAYLNSDDIYMPGTLFAVSDAFATNPGISFVYGNMLIIDSTDTVVSERRLTGYTWVSKLGFIYGGFGVYQPSSFWTKRIYELSGGVDSSLKFCMDNDLFFKFLLKGGGFRFIRKYFAGFRVHEASKTSTIRGTAEIEMALLVQRYGFKRNSLISNMVHVIVWFHRAIRYVFQGDKDYLFFRIFKDKLKWVP